MRRLGDTRVGETSEEITRRRRDQRKEMKKERAKKEKEDLLKVKQAEASKSKSENGIISNEKPIVADAKVVVDLEEEINGLNEAVEESFKPKAAAPPHLGLPTPPLSVLDENDTQDGDTKPNTLTVDVALSPVSLPPMINNPSASPPLAKVVRFDSKTVIKEIPAEKTVTVQNQEHLQLTFSEAFFLAYALGILSVTMNTSSEVISIPDLFRLFCCHSAFPPLSPASVSLANLNPDNPFLINYVVYHHFRSLGWVVKSGVKFSVDYLLYKRGPVFSHAEFAVLILPSYTQWKGRDGHESKEWYWLHSITRVNSQVKKTVVLVYVDVPTPEDLNGWDSEKDAFKHLFAKYKIREVALRRWIAGRNRD
ncbi:hypothetical protein ABW20_dc0101732 [Dactylellina cionopaga]|nr:hypothetical protein ABW20_dc0101732 [Dactylellina cionopaga]